MPQTKAAVRRSKGKDRRYRQNDGMLGQSRRRGAPGIAYRGAGGAARRGGGGFVQRQDDLSGQEQHPNIQPGNDEAPLTEQIEEIATLPFHRVQSLVGLWPSSACGTARTSH